MVAIPQTSLLAIATGITGAAWSAGMIASLSLIGCPTALGVSKPAEVWVGLYNHGIAIMPKVAVVIASCYLYGAYTLKDSTSITGLVTAAVLAVGIAPFTQTMVPTNKKLQAAAAGQSTETGEVERLIRKWATLNLIRSLFSLSSAVVGLATIYTNEWY